MVIIIIYLLLNVSILLQYYGGKIVDLPSEIKPGNLHVYPGLGFDCKSSKWPCNHGVCIDEYNKYKCNCNATLFTGRHCELGKYKLFFKHVFAIFALQNTFFLFSINYIILALFLSLLFEGNEFMRWGVYGTAFAQEWYKLGLC